MNVTTRHSRLFHKEAVKERILSGIVKRKDLFLEEYEDGFEEIPQQLLVRSESDVFTVSLDTSGDLLYKRGLKRIPAKAPLRESMASAALFLAGYDGTAPLIDPMCGTGTFSIEGAMISKNIPPGFYRKFAFQGWPAFRSGRWRHIKKEAEDNFILDRDSMIFASDKDGKTCQMLASHLRDIGYDDSVCVNRIDFFDLLPSQVTGEKGFVALNPPYGVRLGTKKDSDRLFREIIKKLGRDFRGWKFILIVPEKDREKEIPFQTNSLSFRHGGLNLTLKTGIVG